VTRTRRIALIEACAAAMAALLVARFGGRVLWPPGPVIAALGAFAIFAAAGRWPTLIACARMAVGLLAIEVWHGRGWWALVPVTAVVAALSARRGVSAARPLVPLVVGALAAVVWSGVKPGDNVWRSIGAAAVSAAFVAAAVTGRRSP
jgi:hypothetical protein